MNQVATLEDRPQSVSAETAEHVLGTGDLSRLSTQQRVEYYSNVCRSLGVNPLTRPFRFMTFQGQTVLYATRDLTDQLRNLRKINITIADKQLDGELFIVTARATTSDGRADEDVGAVTLGALKGDARANAIMKAMTKAKRRVTLSICGMGFLDESEVETLTGAATYDAEAERPAARITTSTGEAIGDSIPALDEKPASTARPPTPAEWIANLQADLNAAVTAADVDKITMRGDVQEALVKAPNGAKARINAMVSAAIARTAPKAAEPATADDGWPTA